mgnify:CR=1 FL=1
MTRNLERPLVAIALLLAGFGLVVLYSAGQTDVGTQATGIWQRQLVFLVAASIIANLVQSWRSADTLVFDRNSPGPEAVADPSPSPERA